MKVSIDIEANTVTIVLPINRETSTSGKSVLIATTHGAQPCLEIVDGKPLLVSVNAYISAK